MFATDLIAALQTHPRVNGIFWWYPEYTLNNIVFKNGSEDWSKNFTSGYWNAALFHYKTGRALAALYELKNFADNDTGIEPVERSSFNVQRDSWYTLDGRRLSSAPSQKGLYIHNGKKIVR